MTVTFPALEPWQQAVMDCFIEHPKDKWFVVNSSRQIGKSSLAQIILIYSCLKQSNSVSISVSPIIAQSRKMYEDVLTVARQIIKKDNGSTLEITFINNSKILFRSGEQKDSLRGYTIKGSGVLICDEAAYLQDDLFYKVLVPTTNVNHSDIFLMSTPRYKSGVFYDLYTKGIINADKDYKIMSFDWTKYDTSKYLPVETLELYRQQMPKAAFLAEFCGQFIDSDGAVFGDFKRCIQKTELIPDFPVCITIDWATGQGQDSTAITIGQNTGRHINITDSIAFNDKDTNETIDYIVNLIQKFVNQSVKEFYVLVEKNSIGNVFSQILFDRLDKYQTNYNDNVLYDKEIEISTRTFTTTNKSKERIVKQLITCFENDLISIPKDNKLILELNTFDCKISSLGNPVYAASGNFHDDRVMSLCFMMDLLYNELDLSRIDNIRSL